MIEAAMYRPTVIFGAILLGVSLSSCARHFEVYHGKPLNDNPVIIPARGGDAILTTVWGKPDGAIDEFHSEWVDIQLIEAAGASSHYSLSVYRLPDSQLTFLNAVYTGATSLAIQNVEFIVDGNRISLNPAREPAIKKFTQNEFEVLSEHARFELSDLHFAAICGANAVRIALCGRSTTHARDLSPDDIANLRYFATRTRPN